MKESELYKIIAAVIRNEWGRDLTYRSSGPDFVFEGKAIEVKDSNFRFRKNVSQFTRYMLDYNDFSIAFPANAMNATNLIAITIFELMVSEAFSRSPKYYIVATSAGLYHVRVFDTFLGLWGELVNFIPKDRQLKGADVKVVGSEITHIIQDIDNVLARAAQDCVREKPNYTFTQDILLDSKV